MISPTVFEDADAVIHLAGDPIASGRWNSARKARIRSSRVAGTLLISRTLAKLSVPPRVWISASAIGFYGTRGDELLIEESPPGKGFLAEVCREWEQATTTSRKSIRLVLLRMGMVLSGRGGALARMLPAFRAGLGGPIGRGRQYWSWIAIDDVAAIVRFCVENPEIEGPVLAVAPNPVTSREFAKTLGKVLGRPAALRLPAAMARLGLGAMADEILLSSQRAQPAKLLRAGYAFHFPELEGALRHVLCR